MRFMADLMPSVQREILKRLDFWGLIFRRWRGGRLFLLTMGCVIEVDILDDGNWVEERSFGSLYSQGVG